MRGHVLAFDALGGVPREILYDNLKSVVLERVGDHIRFHPRILDLAGHYHFAPKPCAPYRGNEKGRVERLIQYLRHSFFAARRFTSVDDLNAQLARWIAEVAHVRRAPGHADGGPSATLLDEERARLLPLPEHPMSCGRALGRRLGQDALRALRSQRLLDPAHAREEAAHAASPTSTRCASSTATPRSRATCAATTAARSSRTQRTSLSSRARSGVRTSCAAVTGCARRASTPTRCSTQLALRGENLGGHDPRLLQLLDRYGAPELDRAIAEALARGAPGAASVAHMLDQRHARPQVAAPARCRAARRSARSRPPRHAARARRLRRAVRRPNAAMQTTDGEEDDVVTHARRDRSRPSASHHTAAELDDLVALATKRRWSPTQLLEHVVEAESSASAPRRASSAASAAASSVRSSASPTSTGTGHAHRPRGRRGRDAPRLPRRRAQRRARRAAGPRQDDDRPEHRPRRPARRPRRAVHHRRADAARPRRPGVGARPRPPAPLLRVASTARPSTRSATSPTTPATPTCCSRSSAAGTSARASS